MNEYRANSDTLCRITNDDQPTSILDRVKDLKITSHT
jgi:hypothetical protein